MARSKILVMDDDLTLLHAVGHVLRWNDYEVQLCAEGEQGVEVAREWMPDLILLDLVLTGMDGFEVLSKLKTSPATRNIPVVVITGYASEKNAMRANAMGALAFVAKPMRSQDLIRRVEGWLGQD